MKEITILALHLGYGGIEKCISSLSNMLCNEYKIKIISTYKLYDEPKFPINNNVEIEYLIKDLKPNKDIFLKNLKKFKFIKAFKEGIVGLKILKLKKEKMVEAIKNCTSDVIISTRDIHNQWVSKYANKEILKIGWEHNFHNNDNKYINKIVKSVSNLDYFVLVSKTLEQFYHEKLINTNCKTINIPNALDYYPNKPSNLSDERIVSVGRLSKEKGFLDLIDVFKIVNKFYPNWHLDIIGDGTDKEKIQNKINQYNLNKNITLHGFQNKDYINKVLEKSSIYTMCSFTEAFPVVLLEASSFGIPCIAFDCASGAKEIIKDNWDGYLVENRDKEKMAKRIGCLIKNKNRRVIMGNNSLKKSFDYKEEIIKKQWIEIIEKGR